MLTSQDRSLIARACDFAAAAHRAHTRKGGDIPYIAHPTAVAMDVIAVLARLKTHADKPEEAPHG